MMVTTTAVTHQTKQKTKNNKKTKTKKQAKTPEDSLKEKNVHDALDKIKGYKMFMIARRATDLPAIKQWKLLLSHHERERLQLQLVIFLCTTFVGFRIIN